MYGLRFKAEPYSPILQVKADGNFKFIRVTEYNSKWLKMTKDKAPKDNDSYVPLEPIAVWVEDRWILCRRLLGDEFCQKVFYRMCTFVWLDKGIKAGDEVRAYQDALIEEVFGYRNKQDFVNIEKKTIEVTTFDGKYSGYITDENMKTSVSQVGVSGPSLHFSVDTSSRSL